MRHVKLTGMDDIKPQVFAEFVHQAVALNLQKGDLTKGK
jgi:hypothetical protein